MLMENNILFKRTIFNKTFETITRYVKYVLQKVTDTGKNN